jgi:hypothetical protein
MVLEFREKETSATEFDEVLVAFAVACVTSLKTYLNSGLKVGDYTIVLPYIPGYALAGPAALALRESRPGACLQTRRAKRRRDTDAGQASAH